MTEPLVTIVTPSYNQGVFIRETIESVLSQDYPNLEYIVMDGGSTDQTAVVVGDYASRLTWISEKDRGQAHAINKGFQRARGEIVSWLNSDDVLLAGAIKRATNAFAEAPNVGAVYGEGYTMDRAGRRTGRFPFTEPFNLWKLVHLSDYVLQQSTFFRRAAVEDVGWLDEDLHYALDWDLLIRLGRRFGLHYVPEYLGVIREYADAKTSSGGWKRIEEIRRVLEKHTGLKRPPGFWIYALDNVQREWRTRVVDRAPRALRYAGRLANLFVYVPAGGTILLIARYAQGLYDDGWASSRVKWMLPEGSGDVVVRGTLPTDGRFAPMSVTAVAAERRLGRWTVDPGDFELRFAVPPQAGPFSFELHASRSRLERGGSDKLPRRVSYLLRSAYWDGAPVEKTRRV